MPEKQFKIEREELKNLYFNQKLSISSIAKVYGCSYITVWKRMKEFKIKPRTLSEAMKLVMERRKIQISEDELRNLYEKRKLSTLKIAKIYNCYHQTILRKMKEFGIKSRENTEANTLYPKYNFSGNLIEKAYLLGFRMGDLNVYKTSKTGKTIRIEGNSTKLSQMKLIKKMFGKYGHFKKYKAKGFRGDDFWHGYCLVNNTFDFLLIKKESVPLWILNNKKYFFPFLAGYIDAEGSIKIYGNKGCIKQARFLLTSYDKIILHQIREKLISVGIKCGRLGIVSPKGYKTEKKPLPYNENYYGFGIFSKNSLLCLFDNIQNYIKHPKRFRDLKKAKKNIEWRNKKFGNLRMK